MRMADALTQSIIQLNKIYHQFTLKDLTGLSQSVNEIPELIDQLTATRSQLGKSIDGSMA